MSAHASETIAEPASTAEVGSTYRKVTLRLMPFLFICYVTAYLDRINVGFAQLQMKQALGFSDAVYGLGAGIFFAGYVMFEVPSNLLLERVGAKVTLLRIMVLWGLTSAAMMFVNTPAVFYVLRFLLGVFEAGFFPGMVLYLTYWFPSHRRGHVLAIFLTATAMAGVIGGPLSGALISQLHAAHGLDGWQWMFLLEGLPACILGVVAFFYLDDRPAESKWLGAREKAIIQHELARDSQSSPLANTHSFGDAVKSPKVYAMALSWFTFICGVYVISFWLPLLIRDAGVAEPLRVGLLTAIPYSVAVVAMVAVSRHSDRSGERRWHTALCALVGAIGLVLIAQVVQAGASLVVAMLLLSVATAAILTLQPLYWAMATDYLRGTRAAAGTIAFMNSIGLVGGFVSPSIIGWVKTTTGNFANGLYVMAVLLIVGMSLTLLFGKSPTLGTQPAE